MTPPGAGRSGATGRAADERWHVEVRGVVQGVGFRPFVHRLATSLGLTGAVGNDTTRVFIEVEGPPDRLERFLATLRDDHPPLAHIERIDVTQLPPAGDDGFRIVASRSQPGDVTSIPPDVALCADCRRELSDPDDRRFGHPFITCTNCGPRLTIIRELPYDRPSTTMRDFPMCAACAAEYADPTDRRYHAQPIGCHDCGPVVRFVLAGAGGAAGDSGDGASGDRGGRGPDAVGLTRDAAIDAAVDLIARGGIVAVKGIGGYHLACDASAEATVAELRRRKHRGGKPFAVMVADVEAARRVAFVDADETRSLESPANPIVLLRASPVGAVAPSVAPRNPLLGVLLPTSGLHHLLIERLAARGVGTVVMTSGNRSGETIAYGDRDAFERLASIADAFLTHDREIHVPCDDSVVRVVGGAPLPMRRSRGYAPMPLRLPQRAPALLATGGELKNTFCLVRDTHAWMSQHIGDMEHLESLEAFERALAHTSGLLAIAPRVAAVDAHPDATTARWARRHGFGVVVPVQHHHAHVASLIAEHGLPPDEPILGVAFDGTGFGDDGTIWGGEFLVANAATSVRVAHLRPVPLPGGDAGARHPHRIALSHLQAAGIPWEPDLPPVAATPAAERELLARQLETGFRCVPTTSMGRLFDAASSLLGICHVADYEAQAAIELEGLALADGEMAPTYRFAFDGTVLDPAPVWRAMIGDRRAGGEAAVPAIAAGFHVAVAVAIAEVAEAQRAAGGPGTIGLTGGVFQNGILLAATTRLLRARGWRVLTHRIVPANDGGLALGQALVAAQRVRQGG